ncbi:unnamed protein product, partial [Oppiella nova]
ALNAFDCYLIGKQTFDNKEYLNAKQWLTEAIDRLDDMTSDEIIADIFNYLSFCELKIGKPSESQKYKRLSAAIKPDIERNELISEIKMFNDTNTTSYDLDKPIFDLTTNGYELCRKKSLLNDSIVSKLKCFHLNTTKTPFLRLTRIKVEEMYKSPKIVVIHDFLSECETQTIISLAQPSLDKLFAYGFGPQIDFNIRLARGSLVYDRQHKVVHTISRRIGAITGLNMDFAEPYKAMKYSVGGYFSDHYDPGDHQRNASIIERKRMVTWINYLSDVGAGGATVFPLINVTVWPAKYSALFWHNLHKSGQLDRQTLHAGCPVLVGHKWIANKWIPSMGQEFIKPCDPYDRHSRLELRLIVGGPPREVQHLMSTGCPFSYALTSASTIPWSRPMAGQPGSPG